MNWKPGDKIKKALKESPDSAPKNRLLSEFAQDLMNLQYDVQAADPDTIESQIEHFRIMRDEFESVFHTFDIQPFSNINNILVNIRSGESRPNDLSRLYYNGLQILRDANRKLDK